MKRLSGFLLVSALVVALAAPLAAQTLRVTANVPFEFVVGGQSMPAGEYSIASAGPSTTSAIRVSNGSTGVLSLAMNSSVAPQEQTGQALLIFHRYGDQYFLSRIVDGVRSTVLELPTSRTEKELSKTASLQKFETISVLARR